MKDEGCPLIASEVGLCAWPRCDRYLLSRASNSIIVASSGEGVGPLGMLKGTILRPVTAVGDRTRTGGFRRDPTILTGELRVSVTLFGLNTSLRPLEAQWLRRPRGRPLGGLRRPVVLYPRSPVAIVVPIDVIPPLPTYMEAVRKGEDPQIV